MAILFRKARQSRIFQDVVEQIQAGHPGRAAVTGGSTAGRARTGGDAGHQPRHPQGGVAGAGAKALDRDSPGCRRGRICQSSGWRSDHRIAGHADSQPEGVPCTIWRSSERMWKALWRVWLPSVPRPRRSGICVGCCWQLAVVGKTALSNGRNLSVSMKRSIWPWREAAGNPVYAIILKTVHDNIGIYYDRFLPRAAEMNSMRTIGICANWWSVWPMETPGGHANWHANTCVDSTDT